MISWSFSPFYRFERLTEKNRKTEKSAKKISFLYVGIAQQQRYGNDNNDKWIRLSFRKFERKLNCDFRFSLHSNIDYR